MKYRKMQQSKFGLPVTATGSTQKSKNLNEIWKIIKTITYKNRRSISIPNSFYNADETPIGEHDIADAFNNFFTNIGSNLSKQITPQCSSICDTLLNTNCNSMFLSETNVSEIITIVSKLIIIIMVIFKCYFSGELIALS